jgi:4'-phosphopantetheinyl transferase
MRPSATPGMVDVWKVDLGDEAFDELGGLLCVGERARAAQLVSGRDQLLWTRSRGALRMLLGRYLDHDPRRIRFELGPYGKPRLAEPGRQGAEDRRAEPERTDREHDLRFNLSHSGELMLLAVTAGAEIGIDVERSRARYTPRFLKQWTEREAIVKCFGTGLARARIVSNGGYAPWTAELDIGPGAFAAVAIAGGPCRLRRLDGVYEQT